MNQPENMTLGAMLAKTESDPPPEVPQPPEIESSLSDRFSFPGRIAVLLAVIFSPWALGSVRPGAQCIVMALMLIGLGFWWFETAFHERKSQVFPYLFIFVIAGLLIGIFQVIPLPGWMIEMFALKQSEIYKSFSGNPDSAVTISLDREGSWAQIRLLVIGICGLLLGCRFFRTKRDTIFLLGAVTFNGALISFVSIIQKVMGQPYGLYDLPNPLRHFGPFVNPNNAAGYLLMCLAAAIGLIVIALTKPKNEKKPDVLKQEMPLFRETYFQVLEFVSRLNAWKIGLLIMAGLITSGVIATISRGGVLALIAGGIATLLVFGVARKPKNSLFLFVPVLGLIIALTVWLGFSEHLVQKFQTVDVVNVADADVRLNHWKETWPAVGAMGPLGAGLGSYKNVHRLYRSSNESSIFVYAENQFFQSVVEAGWPGLVLFCLAWLLAFQCASLLVFRGSSPFSVGIGTAAVFLIFTQIFASIFDYGLYVGANLVLFSVLIGFVCCHAHYLAGRLKKFSWLKYTMPNYIVQGIVLVMFAMGFVAFLGLFRLAKMDALMRPKAKHFDRVEMDLEQTDHRIEGLAKLLTDSPPVSALNHLGELYLHRSRLGLYQEMKEELGGEGQSFSFQPGVVRTQEENAQQKLENEVLWAVTDLQRIQENAFYLKQSASRFQAEEFLASVPIQSNLPFALSAFELSKKASPLQPVVHLRIGEIKGALGSLKIGSGDEDIEQCLKLAPGNSAFRLVAGVHYLQSNKPEAAVKHLRRFLELVPKKFKELMAVLGGTESRTITFMSEKLIGLEVIPDDPQMLFDYAVKYMPDDSKFKTSVLQRAVGILDARQHTKREFMILSGDVRSALGEYEQAAVDYQRGLVSQPNDPKTRIKLVEALVKVKNYGEALKFAEELRGNSKGNLIYNEVLEYIKKE